MRAILTWEEFIMGHHHDHSHGHHDTDNMRVLFYSFIIISSFMIVEAIGGYLTNSLSLTF